MSNLSDLQAFLLKLEETQTHFTLSSVREGAVMVQVHVPGQRWEVEFFPDREPEVEIFKSDGKMFGPEKLTELWTFD